eukprot:7094654-Prymnesium_polylepis.1
MRVWGGAGDGSGRGCDDSPPAPPRGQPKGTRARPTITSPSMPSRAAPKRPSSREENVESARRVVVPDPQPVDEVFATARPYVLCICAVFPSCISVFLTAAVGSGDFGARLDSSRTHPAQAHSQPKTPGARHAAHVTDAEAL